MLSKQNDQMLLLRLQHAANDKNTRIEQINKIEAEHNRKVKQYIGEGVTFLIIILAGAYLVYRAVKKQLKQSQEQQHFMMAITHELKTPISVAQLNLETIQKRKLDAEQQERLIQNTLHEITRLNSLCNNLLFSSQLEANGYKILQDEINLSVLALDSVNNFIRRYPQRVIDALIDENIIVSGDANLLQILINNLIENAIKYSPKETVITVHLIQQKNTALLKVADKGPGINNVDKERINNVDKEKVFEKFYRMGNEATKRAKGTGLGLYLCKKIVTRHNGKITIADNTGGGSIFAVQLNITD